MGGEKPSRFWMLRENEGAQIVEFAVSLPLLMVLIVGIFDFGTAYTLKQKIGNAALDGVRAASNQPSQDLTLGAGGPCSAPASVCAIRDVVENDLTSSRVNDCGLGTATATNAGLTWTFTTTGSCPGVLTLRIERGLTTTATLPSPPFQAAYTIEASRITLNYPYRWQFDRVIKLIFPGSTYAGPTLLNSVATMQNLN